jgi:hypothetical protein
MFAFFWYPLSNRIRNGRRIAHAIPNGDWFQMRLMELALNLVWAVIAFASYALLLHRLAGRNGNHARGPSSPQCVIALTCMLAILFPVISLTDDLHGMQATAEEASTSGSIMKRCAAGHSTVPARSSHFISCVFASAVTTSPVAGFGPTAAEPTYRPLPAEQGPALGRAPPRSAVMQFA